VGLIPEARRAEGIKGTRVGKKGGLFLPDLMLFFFLCLRFWPFAESLKAVLEEVPQVHQASQALTIKNDLVSHLIWHQNA